MKFIFLIFGFFLLGCNLINEPKVIPPSAQITNIYNITDSSAQFTVQVTQQSNATNGNLLISVYYGASISNLDTAFNLSNDPLPTSISGKISNLKGQTEYTIQLYFNGTFGGGTTYEEDFNIGSPKSFTTK